nr:probable cytochrome P450 313a2 [Drosophila kikkawai]
MGLPLLGVAVETILEKRSQWSLRRKQLSPTFRHSVLLDNLPIINAKTNTLVTLLDALVIEEKIKLKPEDKVNSVINRVIELYQSGDLTYDEVRDECSSLIVVSFDTTALTVANTLILLAMHPEYQERVFNELKEVFPTAEDCELNEKHLKKLVYLERVVNETLRLIPTVPIDPRKTTQPLTLSNGVTIPKGLTIGIDLFHTHRNTDFWGPEASKFNPDNFLPANIQDRHPFAYLPFLKGRRTCLGMSHLKYSKDIPAVARILRNYKLSTSFRYEDLVFVDNISIKLAKQPLLEFQRRN